MPSEVPAVDRARWLAEVSRALDEAILILSRLHLKEEEYSLACDLHVRIETARFEAQSLGVSRSLRPRDDDDPKRTNLVFGMDQQLG